jgi:hypothetical protein
LDAQIADDEELQKYSKVGWAESLGKIIWRRDLALQIRLNL